MVVDNRGIPVEGAEVFVYGSGISCLTGIESGSPRYIVGAVKSGYLTGGANHLWQEVSATSKTRHTPEGLAAAQTILQEFVRYGRPRKILIGQEV